MKHPVSLALFGTVDWENGSDVAFQNLAVRAGSALISRNGDDIYHLAIGLPYPAFNVGGQL